MKTKTKLFLILFMLVVIITTSVFATDVPDATATTEGQAPETNQTEGTTEASEEDIKDTDRFFAGDNVEMSELINGNAFVIGKEVTITGKTVADLFVIAEKLVISEETEIYGNLFAIASEIEINGKMNDAYLVSDKLNFNFNGYIERDLRAFSTEIKIDGIVARNSYIESNKLTIDTDFLTGGNLNYTAQSEAVYIEKQKNDDETETTSETTTIPEDVVKGEIVYTPRNKKLFSKEIKKIVNEILKTNKISNETSEDKIKAVFASYIFNGFGIKTNSEIIKDTAKTVSIPQIYIYINVVIIIALILALVLPKILKKGTESTEEIREKKGKKKSE